MLSSRLRVTRGIRSRNLCTSCCAHLSAGGARSPAVAPGLARSYATARNTSTDGAATEDVKAEKKASEQSDTNDPTAEAVAPVPGTGRKRAVRKTATPLAGLRKKGKAPAKKDAVASKAVAKAAKKENPEMEQTWKDALSLLKELTANPAIRALQEQGHGKAKGKGNGSEKPSLYPDITPEMARRQAKTMQGAVDVLKNVLTIQAANTKKNKAKSPTEPTKEDPASKKADGPTKNTASRKKPSNREVKKVEQKQQPKKKGEQDKQSPKKGTSPQKEGRQSTPAKEKKQTSEGTLRPLTEKERQVMSTAVSKGFAALVANARAKKEHQSIRESITSVQPSKPGKDKKDTKKTASKDEHGGRVEIEKFEASTGGLRPVDVETAAVPLIQYGLDRVLFNEGVYVLQDPRTRIWNFDPYLANIMPVSQFDFEALKEYITSSKDTRLMEVTKSQGRKYTGSTSSMTSSLSHFHYLLSGWRSINVGRLSKDFDAEPMAFTAIQRSPSATILNYKDGVYAIDADKEWDVDTILTMLGKSMEMLLTVPKDEFEKYRRSNSHQLTEDEKKQEESYHYTTHGDFMMRSQLDAYDPRLPGTGVYDLKTRAVVSIRMDAKNHHLGLGYQIRNRVGQWESFEREYFDMIRSAFLKYSLQVRMGRMDGIFVAYHNTERIFGFQYIPLEEMDMSIHGSSDKTLGDREFTASLTLWNKMLDRATERFPGKSLRVHVETRPQEKVPILYMFAEPVTDDEIKEIQESNKEQAEEFRKEVLGIFPEDGEALGEESEVADDIAKDEAQVDEEAVEESHSSEKVEEENSEQVWDEMMNIVEETMENDAQGITAIRDAIQEALEQSGLLHARSPEDAQHYIEALLNAIVDVDAEQAKAEGESEVETEAEVEAEAEAKAEAEVGHPDTAAAADSAPPTKSALSRVFSGWFGQTTPASETSTQDAASSEERPAGASTKSHEPAEREQDQPNESHTAQALPAEESSTLPEDGTESSDATKAIDGEPSPDLVDLIMKLTSRVGSSAPTTNTSQDVSEDQEKLQEFEKILVAMMPQPDASQDKETPTAKAGEPDLATSEGEGKTPKEILGMVLTVRNMVNDSQVTRPENLKSTDKWTIEYSIEEIPDQTRAHSIYEQVVKRRKVAHHKRPGASLFNILYGGALKKKTKEGRTYRDQEDKVAETLPAWVVGQPEPFAPEDVLGDAAANLDLPVVLPSTANKNWRMLGKGVAKSGYAEQHGHQASADGKSSSEETIADSVAKLRAARDPHFKQQREQGDKD